MPYISNIWQEMSWKILTRLSTSESGMARVKSRSRSSVVLGSIAPRQSQTLTGKGPILPDTVCSPLITHLTKAAESVISSSVQWLRRILARLLRGVLNRITVVTVVEAAIITRLGSESASRIHKSARGTFLRLNLRTSKRQPGHGRQVIYLSI